MSVYVSLGPLEEVADIVLDSDFHTRKDNVTHNYLIVVSKTAARNDGS